MHLIHSLASVTVAAALLMSLPCEALAHARVPREAAPHARVAAARPAVPTPFGAECRIAVRGSQAVAHCHNPYVDTDRVRLHVECERWWDLDTDSAPADTGPAETVRLTGRCWKEVRAVWVSHQNRGS
ncbi:hypothetical protein [Streptomyces sp. DH24]|uniref:hypothetical protein n=1 Tax=Streptomyces sp. DH24 TaxID=3040123 RepID=UPI002442D09B|nr:hypothetical protein [Streptomyces sp. DH24]MDG9715037.1 hypothetical protein [Streptomyces sp. DH24]